MDASLQTWLWAGAGLALLASEFASLHLVSGFLGGGALVVAGLRAAGLVESLPASFAWWGVCSTALLLLLRSSLARWAGKPEVTRANVSEDLRAYGTVVDVVVEVTPDGDAGRVRFDGTSWPAVSPQGALPAGAKARLVRRENLTWVVEPAGSGEGPLLPPPPVEG